MEIRQLEYFVMATAFKNFTHAAEALHVSQPSVTKAVQALEAEFSLSLIDRNQKQMALTPEGEVFLQHAKGILSDLETMQQEMSRFSKKTEIRLAFPEVLEEIVFAPFKLMLEEQKSPFVLFPLPCRANQEAKTRVEAGEAHFALLLETENFSGQRLFSVNVSPCFRGEVFSGAVCLYANAKSNFPFKARFEEFMDRIVQKNEERYTRER